MVLTSGISEKVAEHAEGPAGGLLVVTAEKYGILMIDCMAENVPLQCQTGF